MSVKELQATLEILAKVKSDAAPGDRWKEALNKIAAHISQLFKVTEREVAEFYEGVVLSVKNADAKLAANWVSGPLFSLINDAGVDIESLLFGPEEMAALLDMLANGDLNPAAARTVLAELFAKGGKAARIVKTKGLKQVTDSKQLQSWVSAVMEENPNQVAYYLSGKEAVLNWIFGQVMAAAKGKANPAAVKEELLKQIAERRLEGEKS